MLISSPQVCTHLGFGIAGVEHLLRDVKDASIGTLATEVGRMNAGLQGLRSRLAEVQQYLKVVVEGRLPVNHDIIYDLQVRCHSL